MHTGQALKMTNWNPTPQKNEHLNVHLHSKNNLKQQKPSLERFYLRRILVYNLAQVLHETTDGEVFMSYTASYNHSRLTPPETNWANSRHSSLQIPGQLQQTVWQQLALTLVISYPLYLCINPHTRAPSNWFYESGVFLFVRGQSEHGDSGVPWEGKRNLLLLKVAKSCK